MPKPKESLEAENARLKAEVERLESLCKQVMAQHSDISCENIMLRKAGDAMADCITKFRCGKYGNALNAVGGFKVWSDWNTAKEGKPSV